MEHTFEIPSCLTSTFKKCNHASFVKQCELTSASFVDPAGFLIRGTKESIDKAKQKFSLYLAIFGNVMVEERSITFTVNESVPMTSAMNAIACIRQQQADRFKDVNVSTENNTITLAGPWNSLKVVEDDVNFALTSLESLFSDDAAVEASGNSTRKRDAFGRFAQEPSVNPESQKKRRNHPCFWCDRTFTSQNFREHVRKCVNGKKIVPKEENRMKILDRYYATGATTTSAASSSAKVDERSVSSFDSQAEENRLEMMVQRYDKWMNSGNNRDSPSTKSQRLSRLRKVIKQSEAIDLSAFVDEQSMDHVLDVIDSFDTKNGTKFYYSLAVVDFLNYVSAVEVEKSGYSSEELLCSTRRWVTAKEGFQKGFRINTEHAMQHEEPSTSLARSDSESALNLSMPINSKKQSLSTLNSETRRKTSLRSVNSVFSPMAQSFLAGTFEACEELARQSSIQKNEGSDGQDASESSGKRSRALSAD